jgi:hypothetical protein
MAYGFSATNSDGEVVIDTNSPAYQLFDEQTVSGTYDSTYNLYVYPADNASLVFYNIPIGDYVGKTHTGTFISSASSLSFRYLRIAPNVAAPSNYGMKLFDASGNITYSSGAEIEVVKAAYRTGSSFYYTGGSGFNTFPSTLTFDSAYSTYEDSDWYSVTAPVFSTFPSTYQCAVIFRETSTYVHGVMRPYATAPSSTISPEPFYFVTAA